MALVTQSYWSIWNCYAVKAVFAILNKTERQEIILPIEYSINFIVVFIDELRT